MPDESPSQREARLDAVLAEYLSAVDAGRAPPADRWLAANPEFATELKQFLDDQRRFAQAAGLAGSAQEERTAALFQAPANALDAATIGRESPPANPQGLGTLRYFGDYELLEEIARGGMGVVYKTRQENLKRVVALKMILVGQLANAEEVKRFYAEAQAAAKLEHPNIVPIFEIGQHEGQHYFTMAFIDGESLAHRVAREVLPPREAAQIMEKVARAIAYAHVEGVVHRDLKPANILLDGNGEPHVTDFGLAKRVADDDSQVSAQLTATGQVLGTPSYMPPEQAAGKTDVVGPSADVYSLGAVLYCLLTGRPPFQAASPIDTLLQVLQEEPVSPRQLNSSIPRDLETICLKCLEKDPARRYGSAVALADELQRFLQGEAIHARPLGLLETGIRKANKHRRQFISIGMAVAATLLAMALTVYGWATYRSWHEGSLALATSGAPLSVSVQSTKHETVPQTVTAPTDQPLALWHGEYLLNATGPGLPSAEFLVSVEPRRRNELTLDLASDRLWPPIQLNSIETLTAVQFGQRTDLILLESRFDGGKLRRLRGDGLQSQWSVSMEDLAAAPARPSQQGDWQSLVQSWAGNWGARPMFHPQAVLADSDPEPDLILFWPLATQSACAALSGSNGTLLWFHQASDSAHLAAPPLFTPIDADAAPDVLLLEYNPNDGTLAVTALSGGSGQTLWRRPLVDVAPLRTGLPNSTTSRGDTGYSFPFRLALATHNHQTVLFVATDRNLAALRLTDGEPAFPALSLGGVAAAQPQLADLNGDGTDEWVSAVLTGRELRDSAPDATLIAQSLGAPAPLWSVAWPNPDDSHARSEELAAVPWATPVDLNADGLPELIVPFEASNNGLRPAEVVVAALDGATGQDRWRQTLFPRQRAEWKSVLEMPDANGDDAPEILVVSAGPADDRVWQVQFAQRGTSIRLYVDVLSGSDGQRLASWIGPPIRNQTGGYDSPLEFESARWWSPTADGQPQLLISLTSYWMSAPQRQLLLVDPLQGRLTGEVRDFLAWQAGDFNADGLPDLGILQKTLDGQSFQVYSLGAPCVWRRLADLRPGEDFDGDGFCDLLESATDSSQVVRFYSGRDGTPLRSAEIAWRSRDVLEPFQAAPLSPPLGDLDRSGAPDLLCTSYLGVDAWTPSNATASLPLPVQALSYELGRAIWSEPSWTPPQEILDRSPDTIRLAGLECRCTDLDNDGTGEIVCAFRAQWSEPSWGGFWGQLWLAVLSGRDGSLRWQRPVGSMRKLSSAVDGRELPFLPAEAWLDCDGDGCADVIGLVAEPATDQYPAGQYLFDLWALNGRTGQPLWPAQRLDAKLSTLQAEVLQKLQPPQVAVLDPSLPPAVLVTEPLFDPQATIDGARHSRVRAYDGRSGAVRWEYSWSSMGNNYEWSSPQLQFTAVDFAGEGRRTVCVRDYDNTPDTGGAKLYLVGSDGVFLRRIDGPMSWNYDPAAGRLWPIDVDGDGAEELVYQSENRLRALRESGEAVWELNLPGVGHLYSAGLQAGRMRLIAQADQAFLGISGRTGEIDWRCEGLPRQFSSGAKTWLLPSSRSDHAARALGVDGGSLVYTAFPTDSAGVYQPRASGPRTAPLRLTVDPRLVRLLPWQYSSLGQQFAWIAACSLLLVFLPGTLVLWIVRRRSWSLKTWLGLPCLVGYLITAGKLLATATPFAQAEHPLRDVWITGISGLYLFVFPLLLMRWMWQRRWRAFCTLIAASFLSALVGGSVGAWFTAQDLTTGETLANPFDGWENLWLPSTVVVGWLGMLLNLALFQWRRLRVKPRRLTARAPLTRPWTAIAGSVALVTGVAAGLAAAFLAIRLQRQEPLSGVHLLVLIGVALLSPALVLLGIRWLRRSFSEQGWDWRIFGPAVFGGLTGMLATVLGANASVGAVNSREYELTLRLLGRTFSIDRGEFTAMDGEMFLLTFVVGLLLTAGAAFCGGGCGLAIAALRDRWRSKS